ncbi:MAG: TetR/AcrR family transcriptional regulator [Polaromonas sp.]|uniref:TetR/AcrR family transcriptional regulator n=1 Tax=Polaromonas sp. TaxID=1869339 RepID=UPI0027333E6C|nr:TetR/AcrR family transcriptional regulator [Polaromonas sp.]MDP3799234.1 TetR/AcrR family transcriptional regulator [Polaromonas sp.]
MEEGSKIARRRKSALSDGSADYKVKRDEIVQTASRLFAERGYKSTTLAQIAEAAGVDRATVYYYVGSKEELFREAVQDLVDKNAAKAQRIFRDKNLDPKQKLAQLVEALMCSYEEHYPHMYVYIQEEMHQVASDTSEWAQAMSRHTRRWETIFIKLVNEGVAQGVFRSDIPVGISVNALFGMLNWTHRWFKPGGKRNAREIAAWFSEIFFNGMQPGAASAKA